LTPDLVIEVVGKSNTPAEIERKQREYFTSGVKLLWEFDLESRAVTVLTPGGGISLLDASQRLDGGVVLPGLSIALSELFGKLDRRG
jgi:Uma2 family endonuclease